MKTKLYTTLISYIAQVPNPNTYKLINLLIAKIFDLAGDEVVNYKQYLLNESVQPPAQGGMEQTVGQLGMPMSNQNAMPMSTTEQGARGMM